MFLYFFFPQNLFFIYKLTSNSNQCRRAVCGLHPKPAAGADTPRGLSSELPPSAWLGNTHLWGTKQGGERG